MLNTIKADNEMEENTDVWLCKQEENLAYENIIRGGVHMASLTHVCMWSDNGWKRITAEQAAKLHPGGTVSAHSGLFMCELCGQYVSLTDGTVQTRHFRHSADEKKQKLS